MLLAPLLLLVALVAGEPYQPGTPGAPWTEHELMTVKAKFFRVFHTTGTAPKFVRLGFHDCIKYKDGTGGCDGCLNWSGMEFRFNESAGLANKRDQPNIDEGNNNGLEGIVRMLEGIYTHTDHPQGAPSLDVTLAESGKSRADLWAYAALLAVEYGVETTNIACAEGDKSPKILRRGWGQCLHNFGEQDCSVNMARNFKFQTGRSDCVERDVENGYKATKAEHHPNPVGNGQTTIEFFRESFGMTGREVVALMGAHTFGKPHMSISLFPYTWTSKAANLWNNDYFKTITGRPRWFFNPLGVKKGDVGTEGGLECNKVGDAFGNIPETRWLAHTRMSTVRGGPIFWIHENLACPDCNLEDVAERDTCCQNVPAGQSCRADRAAPGEPDTSPWSPLNTGCEKFRFISGADEIALNAEMGLYREFEVTDGIIHGCPGLEDFNTRMSDPTDKTTVWSKGEDGWNGEPRCEKQRLEEPAGSGEPLYTIFEEYADSQDAWMRDYVPAMEKMLANGYTDLVDAPDHVTGITCPFPTAPKLEAGQADWAGSWSCYREEAVGPGPVLVLRSYWTDWDPQTMLTNWATGRVVQAGETREEFWSFTGSLNQQWAWSESGRQLLNLGTGRPLGVGGFTEWAVDATSGQRPVLLTLYGGKALDAWPGQADGCGGSLVAGNVHFGPNQWFTLVPLEDMVPESSPCAPTTTATTATTTTTTTTTATTATTTTTTTTTRTPVILDGIPASTGACTDDGSSLETIEFIIQNVKDSYVVTLNTAGEPTLSPRDASDPTQLWRSGTLCSGGALLSNVGTGQQLGPGPWTFDPATKLLQAGDGKWVQEVRRGHKFKLVSRVRWLKGQTGVTPWKWFQWNFVSV